MFSDTDSWSHGSIEIAASRSLTLVPLSGELCFPSSKADNVPRQTLRLFSRGLRKSHCGSKSRMRTHSACGREVASLSHSCTSHQRLSRWAEWGALILQEQGSLRWSSEISTHILTCGFGTWGLLRKCLRSSNMSVNWYHALGEGTLLHSV